MLLSPLFFFSNIKKLFLLPAASQIKKLLPNGRIYYVPAHSLTRALILQVKGFDLNFVPLPPFRKECYLRFAIVSLKTPGKNRLKRTTNRKFRLNLQFQRQKQRKLGELLFLVSSSGTVRLGGKKSGTRTTHAHADSVGFVSLLLVKERKKKETSGGLFGHGRCCPPAVHGRRRSIYTHSRTL